MPNQLTTQQLTDAQTMITRGDVVGFYNYMYSQGYGYANLAKGVVECSLPSGGATALQYMTDVSKQAGINLTTQQVAKIEIDMANGYVNTLKTMAKDSGSVSQDINGDQALQFHNGVFDKNGLPREAWTLYTPSQYLSKEQFNADFAASIAPGSDIMNSGQWALDMTLAANAYEAAKGAGFSNPANARATADINSWIVKVTKGTAAAIADAANLTDPISGCQAGVQQTIKQIQQDAAIKQTQNPTSSLSDSPTRPSTNYISDTSANDHAVVIKEGGTVWDAYAVQKNASTGFKDWNEFKSAVAASNPAIADLNQLSAGTKLYMPEKLSDGSTTYNFAGGTAINNNATTGEYHMVVQNEGGGQTVYSRAVDGDAGYTVKQVSTDRFGNETLNYTGYQETLQGEIDTTSIITRDDTNNDGQTDTTTKQYSGPTADGSNVDVSMSWGTGLPFAVKFAWNYDSTPSGSGNTNSAPPPPPQIYSSLDQVSSYELSKAGVYRESDVASRLEQVGLVDADVFNNTGFSGTGADNAGLQANQFTSGGSDYYFFSSNASYTLSSADVSTGAGTGYTYNPQSYGLSDWTSNAVGYMGGATNWVSPLILDMDGDGVATDLTHAYSERVYFDIDNDGAAERVGWTNGQDALLAYDANGNGRIDNITELFGDDQMAAFSKLKAWDSNNDGKVDASDTGFTKLQLWRDTNRDGITQTGELSGLESSGVVSISVVDTPYLQSWFAKGHGLTSAYAQENYLSSATTFVYQDKTGTTQTREIADVHFLNDNLDTWQLGAQSQVYGAKVSLNLQALMLPLSRGYGTLASLHVAMSSDDVLLKEVAQLAGLKANQIGQATDRVEAIMLQWAGVADNDPLSRTTGTGNYMDARQVDFLEQFTGVTWEQRGVSTMVGEDASLGLKKAWAGIEQMMLNRLMIQGPLESIFSNAHYDFSTDKIKLNDTLDTLLGRAKTYAAGTGAGYGDFWHLMGGILAEHKDQFGASLEQIDTAILRVSGIELFMQEYTLTEADGPLYTGKNGATETLKLYTFGGGAGDDAMTGSLANDYLFGKQGNDTLSGGAGDDFMRGDEGNDLLMGGAGYDWLEGGDGNDTLQGGADSDMLKGGAGSDHIDAGAGDDMVFGGLGADVLDGGEGLDTIRTLTASYMNLATGVARGAEMDGDVFVNFENLEGSPFDDELIGDDKDNVLAGDAGNDTLRGGAGDDKLFGYSGNNQMHGGDGNDTFDGGFDGSDYMDGGDGVDTVRYSHPYIVNSDGGITIDLTQGKGLGGVAAGDTLLNIENVVGTSLVDSIIGSEVNNLLFGNGGADTLYGMGGDDVLFGFCQGEHLYGGAGSDTFVIALSGGDANLNSANISRSTYIHDLTSFDQLDLTAVGMTDVVARQRGSDIVINLPLGRELVLVNKDIETFFLSGVNLTKAPYDSSQDTTVIGDSGNNTLYGGSGSDILQGLDGNDVLLGGAGRDSLVGGSGDDTMIGGEGSDAYVVDSLKDRITENANEGTDTVDVQIATEGGTYKLSDNVENAKLTNTIAFDLTGNDLANVLTGNQAANILIGGSGDDTLDGMGGNDILMGGVGNDTYTIHSLSDQIKEGINEGTDMVNLQGTLAGGTYALGTNIENATLLDSAAYKLVGNELDNILKGNDGADTLVGGLGKDILRGGGGNDLLDGGAGDDILNGEAGADIMRGGSGDDLYVVDDAADVVIENTNEGIDRINSRVSLTLQDSVENLVLLDYSTAISGVGNSLNNQITGNAQNNVIEGAAGNDVIAGEGGNDKLLGGDGADLIDGGTGNNQIFGGEGDDALFAGNGVDSLDGGNGTDTVYYNLVESTAVGVTVNLAQGKGTGGLATGDTLVNIENITGTSLADVITGNEKNNILNSLGGGDTINGGAGDDTLDPGENTSALATVNGDSGNDTLLLRSILTSGSFNGGDGTDWLDSSQQYASSGEKRSTDDIGVLANLSLGKAYTWYDAKKGIVSDDSDKQLTVTGIENIRGTSQSDALLGNAGANVLDGGDGNDFFLASAETDIIADSTTDTMIGGGGNDRFYINIFGAANISGGDGQDTLNFSGSGDYTNSIRSQYGYGVSVNMSTGFAATAYSSAAGGYYNNSYLKISYSGIENIVGTGEKDQLYGDSSANSLTGGAKTDLLIGGAGDDTLDGGTEADVLEGGSGNDVYIVDNALDTIFETSELATEIDTIQSSISYTLGEKNTTGSTLFGDKSSANVENLVLTGAGQINGSGNSLNNKITGNAANNVLLGNGGNDTLTGGAGSDTLNGGAGNDAYVFGVGDGADLIQGVEGIDTLTFNSGIKSSDVTVTRTSTELTLHLNAQDSVRWQMSSGAVVDRVRFADGTTWYADANGNLNASPTGKVAVVGTAIQNQTLTVSHSLSDTDGLGAVKYQWQASSDDLNWSPVVGATSESFVLGQSQSGQSVRVMASYVDGYGSAESVVSAASTVVRNTNDLPTGAVLITGTATQGQTLTVSHTLADADGLGTVSYQWWADGAAIDGATASTLTLKQAQVGKSIHVTASYMDGYGALESMSSSATAAVANLNDLPTGTVSITGTATQGQTLTASHTLADADGLGTVSYQWLADGVAINGATASTLTLTQAQVGKSIQVTASYIDGQGAAEAVNSLVTGEVENINDVPTGLVVVSMNSTATTATTALKQGDALTVSNTLADLDGVGVVSYQWLADGQAITGASSSNFAPTAAQVSKAISVKASYIDAAGSLESIVSAPTPLIGWSDDLLSGSANADTLAGGAGNDILVGGKGADTYVFNLGDGQDTIYDYENVTSDQTLSTVPQDVLKLGDGIEVSQTQISRDGNNLVMVFNANDQVTLRDYFANDASRIELIEFADGTQLPMSQFMALHKVPPPSIGEFTLSADTGSQDFVTQESTQTITASLSKALEVGEKLWGTLDGGQTWRDITDSVSGTVVNWCNQVLNQGKSGTNILQFKAEDEVGNTTLSMAQSYTVLTHATINEARDDVGVDGLPDIGAYRYAYLRLDKGLYGRAGLAEVQVLDQDGVNVALGKRASYGGFGSVEIGPAGLVDGVSNTDGFYNSWHGANGFIKIDLGAQIDVACVKVFGTGANWNDSYRSEGFSVWLSNEDIAQPTVSALQTNAVQILDNTPAMRTTDANPNNDFVMALAPSVEHHPTYTPKTNDATPLFNGTLDAPLPEGYRLQVLNNGIYMGDAHINGTEWSYEFEYWQSVYGANNVQVCVVDAAGSNYLTSNSYNFEMTNAPVSINRVIDDLGADSLPDIGTYRYAIVRVDRGGSGRVGFSELQVFDQDGTNVALGKTVSYGEFGSASGGAGLVDGATDKDGFYNSWSWANGFIKLDLGVETDVASVKLWGTGANWDDPWRSAGASVWLSKEDIANPSLANLQTNAIQILDNIPAMRTTDANPNNDFVIAFAPSAEHPPTYTPKTNDATPLFSGSFDALLPEGYKLEVLNNGIYMGDAQIDGTQWRYGVAHDAIAYGTNTVEVNLLDSSNHSLFATSYKFDAVI